MGRVVVCLCCVVVIEFIIIKLDIQTYTIHTCNRTVYIGRVHIVIYTVINSTMCVFTDTLFLARGRACFR